MNHKVNFFNALESLIKQSVINQPILDFYDQWHSNFDLKNKKNVVLNKDFISKELKIPENSRLAGIDLPTWFGDFSKKRIVILGIDPLRNERTFKKEKANIQEDVIIGTPYAFHEPESRIKGCSSYWALVNKLSEEHFVYCTDIFKAYFVTDHGRSYDNKIYVANPTHRKLLNSELSLIDPEVIVVLGKKAHKFLLSKTAPKLSQSIEKTISTHKNNNSDIKVITVPHLSKSVRNNNMEEFFTSNGLMEINPGDRKACGLGYASLIKRYI